MWAGTLQLDVDGIATMIDLEQTETGVGEALRAVLGCRGFAVVRLGRLGIPASYDPTTDTVI